MGTDSVTKIEFIDRLREKNILLFTVHDVVKLFNVQNRNTLKHLLMRLTKDKIIEQLARGKYIFLHGQKQASDFEIANFLIQPSYISLESALSFYGMIEQFPYQVISITIKKTKKLKCRGKIFSYSKIKKEYFKDFTKHGNYLIATKEKALFDFAYYIYNGLRSPSSLRKLSGDFKTPAVKKYLQENSTGKFHQFIKKYA